MKPPIQFRPDPKKKHATVGSRRVVASGQNPKGTPLKKTGDEVSVAQATHGQSSEPQQLNFDRKAYQRDYMRDKRAADKLGLTVAEYREQKK